MTANLSSPVRPTVEPADLSFESTVPRAIVHRHAVSEVFLTDSARLSDTEFLVAAHLPTTHGFFGDQLRSGRADPLYFVEVSRQACVLLAHRYFDVPRGFGFVFRGSTMSVLDAGALRLGAEPARVVLTVSVPDVQYRNGTAYLMELSIVASVDGRRAIRFGGVQLMLPRETFAQLRATGMAQLATDAGGQDGPPLVSRDPETLTPLRPTRPLAALEKSPSTSSTSGFPPPCQEPRGSTADAKEQDHATLEPAAIGRTDPRNVVLSPAGDDHELIVDRTHPVFFDHPQDHAPGLLLVEAFQQAAFAALYRPDAAPPALESLDLTFDRFVELDVPVRVRSRVDGPVVTVELVQGGQTAARATVRVR
ncbi:MAG: hypothetical protein GEV28_35755 [Actinophytocola sp.]|uniref:AfsA-related hotdog domain-containing protein n=1 Tax=Actinophytocola sp. TaxID=1872138 RepID=UPI001322A296|nr:AfsA-related hotdog domain-containing protein [Actinophytocola sp.]MPZ85458.1 hypothetical protein [Actinophytocola sp.]